MRATLIPGATDVSRQCRSSKERPARPSVSSYMCTCGADGTVPVRGTPNWFPFPARDCFNRSGTQLLRFAAAAISRSILEVASLATRFRVHAGRHGVSVFRVAAGADAGSVGLATGLGPRGPATERTLARSLKLQRRAQGPRRELQGPATVLGFIRGTSRSSDAARSLGRGVSRWNSGARRLGRVEPRGPVIELKPQAWSREVQRSNSASGVGLKVSMQPRPLRPSPSRKKPQPCAFAPGYGHGMRWHCAEGLPGRAAGG
jgi:hypothetical protein